MATQAIPTAGYAISRHGRGAFMPLRLKEVLRDRGIKIVDWAGAVRQADGRPLSTTAASLLLNWDDWPLRTPRASIVEQTERFLRAHRVPAREIDRAWEVSENVTPYGRGVKAQINRARRAAAAPDHEVLNPLPETEMLSQAARSHFKLFRDPFVDDVQGPEDVFLSKEQRYIREAMFQTARHGGFLAVIGESGAGKTVLRRDLIERIAREQQPITVIQPQAPDKLSLTAAHLCDAIICDLSQESPRRSHEGKARQIRRLLSGSSRAGNAHVLIIEEAHDLSVQMLKYLKRFWELEDGFRKLLAILLIGQPELKGKLDERQNWGAREVIRRCEIAELRPLNGDLEEYVGLKFTRLGADPEQVFEPDAYPAIQDRLTLRRRGTDVTESMHYPLVVNNLVVKCMNLAADIGAPKVSADVVRGV